MANHFTPTRIHRHRRAVTKPLTEKELPPALRGMYRHYKKEMGEYMALHRPFLSRATGTGGTMSNLQQGTEWFFYKFLELASPLAPAADDSDARAFADKAKDSIRAGCVAVSNKTYAVLNAYMATDPGLKDWRLHFYMVGNVMEHHTIAVSPPGAKEDGWFVFDPWITQVPEVYSMKVWQKEFSHWSVLGDPRDEWE